MIPLFEKNIKIGLLKALVLNHPKGYVKGGALLELIIVFYSQKSAITSPEVGIASLDRKITIRPKRWLVET